MKGKINQKMPKAESFENVYTFIEIGKGQKAFIYDIKKYSILKLKGRLLLIKNNSLSSLRVF